MIIITWKSSNIGKLKDKLSEVYGLDELGKLCTLYARSLTSFALGAAKVGLNYCTDEDDNDRDNHDDNDNNLGSEDNETSFNGKKGITERKNSRSLA